jgi:TRAP-type uncharacterized transport system fused permease subunit
MFTVDPKSVGILLKGPVEDIVWTVFISFVGLSALAAGVENWLFRKTTTYERLMLIAGGLILVYPVPIYDAIGFLLLLAVLVSQKLRAPS